MNTFMIISLETIIPNYKMGIEVQYLQWNMKMKMIVKIHLNCTIAEGKYIKNKYVIKKVWEQKNSLK